MLAHVRVILGIIPARAGFTLRRYCARVILRDHPRSRGVYFLMGMEDSRVEGSSPLARGLLPRNLYDFVDNRIIPARAGFTH